MYVYDFYDNYRYSDSTVALFPIKRTQSQSFSFFSDDDDDDGDDDNG